MLSVLVVVCGIDSFVVSAVFSPSPRSLAAHLPDLGPERVHADRRLDGPINGKCARLPRPPPRAGTAVPGSVPGRSPTARCWPRRLWPMSPTQAPPTPVCGVCCAGRAASEPWTRWDAGSPLRAQSETRAQTMCWGASPTRRSSTCCTLAAMPLRIPAKRSGWCADRQGHSQAAQGHWPSRSGTHKGLG